MRDRRARSRATPLLIALGVVAALVLTAPPALAVTPNITTLTPNHGVPGTPVTITGSGFNNPPVTIVEFRSGLGNVGAPFVIVSDTTITTAVPCGAHTGNVTVINATSGGSENFSVDPAQAPTVTSFSPTVGVAGVTSVAITGTNLCGATGVTFNTRSATSFTVDSGTRITTTVPAGATTGKIAVTTPVSTGVSSADFTVLAGPTVTAFAPTSGRAGSSVSVSGSGFTGATAVSFGGTSATEFTVDSDTQMSATVPDGAGTGSISVVGPGGTSESSADFTVIHAREVSLTLTGKKGKGTIEVVDGFAGCASEVPVRLQHLEEHKWHAVAGLLTRSNGSFSAAGLVDPGKYRAVAKKVTLLSGDVCLKKISHVAKK